MRSPNVPGQVASYIFDDKGTGCWVTPCSALFQASCKSPDDQRGRGLPPEDVGVFLGITICKKSPAEAPGGGGGGGGKCEEVARSATRF
jgi:hypothetical protein